MPLMGHLTEIRKRLTWSAVVVLVFVVAAFIEKDYVLDVLRYPLRHTAAANQGFSVFGPTDAFMTVLKLSIYAGLLCAVPFLLYQFWAFILPGLYENEKRSTIPYVFLTTGLFLGGVAFGYFIVLPVGLRFLINYGHTSFNNLLAADRYLSFIAMFELAFGIVFELPLIMMLLAWAGIIDYKRMAKYRKYAILIEAVVAMVLTPSQDPVSMMLMLGPLIVLYEFGIVLARMTGNRRKRRQEAKALEASGKDGDNDQHLSEATSSAG
jgi:sec-independent protein translocase protein TatC